MTLYMCSKIPLICKLSLTLVALKFLRVTMNKCMLLQLRPKFEFLHTYRTWMRSIITMNNHVHLQTRPAFKFLHTYKTLMRFITTMTMTRQAEGLFLFSKYVIL